ncbi:hypothetical protein EET67_21725 [Pseudaminobacter arsenicus]|uniref:Adenosylcobinamide amidohydrolase n=1 Tax=Borborobacter arsenicus TaxID=1851146 RepID=A0A432V0P4_9HYPH|nr:adenosylcobinamide amidohydrolase [Pseudaminobacter arsenicus]RUM95668.1 hypothetical protein EET67_21725 [Pseudaminobacter arsenicus]
MIGFSISCRSPFLVVQFEQPQTMLSWSLTRPGFTVAASVAWLGVRDDDLSLDIDPIVFLKNRMEAAGLGEAIHLMTSRDVSHHHLTQASFGSATATCLATVGLGNAGRVGEHPAGGRAAGTINLLAHVDQPLTQAAMVEAVSIAAEARTTAIIDLDWLAQGKTATGTGTDCIVIAAPCEGAPRQFAGLHTDIGAAIGRAVHDAVWQGGEAWIREKVETALA